MLVSSCCPELSWSGADITSTVVGDDGGNSLNCLLTLVSGKQTPFDANANTLHYWRNVYLQKKQHRKLAGSPLACRLQRSTFIIENSTCPTKKVMLCSHAVNLRSQTWRGSGGWGQSAEVEGGVAHGTLCFGLQTAQQQQT